MDGWERVQLIMKNEGFNKNSFSEAIGLNNNVTITRILNEKRKPSPATFNKIADRFPRYNRTWLLTGKGEMLNPQSSNVTINGGESQNNIGGQMINISLPEKGSQKIIKPDGTVEVHSMGKNIDNSNNTDKFIELLKKKDEQIDRLITLLEKK